MEVEGGFPVSPVRAVRALQAGVFVRGVFRSGGRYVVGGSDVKSYGMRRCERHDFGYRGYKYYYRFTAVARLLIDINFRRDLYNECAKYTGWQANKGVICRRIATPSTSLSGNMADCGGGSEEIEWPRGVNNTYRLP